jgi:hypothetical protein
MAVACVLLVVNRGDLSGAADAVYIEILPWVVLVVFVIGMAGGRLPPQQRP